MNCSCSMSQGWSNVFLIYIKSCNVFCVLHVFNFNVSNFGHNRRAAFCSQCHLFTDAMRTRLWLQNVLNHRTGFSPDSTVNHFMDLTLSGSFSGFPHHIICSSLQQLLLPKREIGQGLLPGCPVVSGWDGSPFKIITAGRWLSPLIPTQTQTTAS